MINIYDYATTEYAQDAFISWMCANYNSKNSYRKKLAELFIKDLLGINNFNFVSVKVENQVSYIDICLTLTDSKGNEKK